MEENKPKRKTTTSSKVKNRWNKLHYDRLSFTCRIGGGSLVKELAAAKGMSLTSYILWLVEQDALKSGRNDVSEYLRGGG